jgi:hypothetical protein
LGLKRCRSCGIGSWLNEPALSLVVPLGLRDLSSRCPDFDPSHRCNSEAKFARRCWHRGGTVGRQVVRETAELPCPPGKYDGPGARPGGGAAGFI